MFYRLKERYLLRGWDKLPYAVADRENGQTVFTTRDEMEALKLCNGAIDVSLPLIPEKLREMISIMEERGMVEVCEAGSRILPQQEYYCYPCRYIRTAHWSITGRCNYRCRHCYMSAPDAKLGELSHNAVMDIVEQLAECGVMNVSITGGEPLIRRDFLEIVDALLEKGIRITTIYSNGKLVTDELLDSLSERGIRPEFNMSFDGVGYHDWLRGVPDAEKYVEEAFLRCRDRGFPAGAEMCIFEDNKHTLRESVNRLAGWGCRSLKTNPISDVGAWKEGGYGAAIDIEELYRLYLEYIAHYYEDGMPLSLQLGGFFSANPKKPDQFEIPLAKNCKEPRKTCICGHARMVMYISAEGRTLPCMSLSGMEIQNKFPLISELGLARCLTDSFYMHFIDTRVSNFFDENPDCAGCEYATECIGGCRAGGLVAEPDNLLSPDPYACRMFKGGWVPRIKEAAHTAIEKRKYMAGGLQ